MKKALITGVTGQDGSYLTELLLEKGYQVYGLQRRASYPNTYRIDHLYDNPAYPHFTTFYGDLSESSHLSRIIVGIAPDEIYNLGAQSHVGVSFEVPEYTVNVTGVGTLRILEAIRALKLSTKFYQASSSEMFGAATVTPQNETTPFNPQSPYGAAKVFAYHITKIYRNSYKLFAVNGILFNHESPRRGITFITRKVTLGLSRIKRGLQQTIRVGNLDAKRDWGYAKDYVEGIWRILHYHTPDDFVLATGTQHTIRAFIEEAGKNLKMDIVWKGKGLKECGIDKKTGRIVVEIDSLYFRPSEVVSLCGDARKARTLLGWKPKVNFAQLVALMVRHDYDIASQEVRRGKHIEVHKQSL